LILFSIGTDLTDKFLFESLEVLFSFLGILIDGFLDSNKVVHLIGLIKEARSEVLGIKDSHFLFVYKNK
jgi:hypothetical protein